MSEARELAQSYRFRAEELRAIADLDRDTPNREILIQVAQDYDRMAHSMEAVGRTHRSISRV